MSRLSPPLLTTANRGPESRSDSQSLGRAPATPQVGKTESRKATETPSARARSQFPPSVVSLLAAADDAVVAVGRGSHFHRA